METNVLCGSISNPNPRPNARKPTRTTLAIICPEEGLLVFARVRLRDGALRKVPGPNRVIGFRV